ncbi:type II toxin-antitoxin system HipA family toxin [Flavitalea flava]
MAKTASTLKQIWVYADWAGLGASQLMGILQTEQVRGKEIFSFTYDKAWLADRNAVVLDPDLGLFAGPQYIRAEKSNFGLFTDSAPDRWGRVLMERREAFAARKEGRKPGKLMESNYLLGVFDLYRMGALRFKMNPEGLFLDANAAMAAPPMTSLRTLEEASLHLEDADGMEDPAFSQWLNLLMAPGSSLGGARPKASVISPEGELWIAKFPSRKDDWDIGAWEAVVNNLAIKGGMQVAEGVARRFTQSFHTYLTKRFDRVDGGRLHFASAMTLLGQTDGADAGANVSYLHLAELLMRNGARPDNDLEELWRRIVFNICVSNSDDHLRNHGFILTSKGWVLSPAYDLNPIPFSTGLSLNISEQSNALDLDLAREVAGQFRLQEGKREAIIKQVTDSVGKWRTVAEKIGLSRSEMQRMEPAFLAD